MLVDLEKYYKSLRDKKSEARLRSLWFLIPSGVFILLGYWIDGEISRYPYFVGAVWGYVVLLNIVSPLTKRERAFENVYKAMELLEHQDNPSTQRKLRRLLKGVLRLPVGTDDPLLTEGRELRKKMRELVRHRLLPAARAGKVKHTTLEMLAELLQTPSIDKVKEFNGQLTKGYDEVEEATVWKKVSQFRTSSVGLLIEPLAKALVLGFTVALGAAYVWATTLGHQDLSTYLNSNPVFGAAIFSFAGVLTVGLFSHFRGK